MKRPSMYPAHEASLKAFTELFNGVRDRLPLVMQIYQTENFRDDGVIVHTRTGKRVAFDWEKRDRYFTSGRFAYRTLWQFERKIKKDEIGLSLQCDSDETAVLVAWHQDWLQAPVQRRSLRQDSPGKVVEAVRETRHFRIYPYTEIRAFRKMIHRALTRGLFDHRVFEESGSSS
ncbi:MAG: hypothetical protein D6762_03455 [Candidatus Neomarinimicrobiota bacterium]|nr:MAG: hypothetical protein D6762_03455 [Candidatus Neomarinimicrobiota bacterium]